MKKNTYKFRLQFLLTIFILIVSFSNLNAQEQDTLKSEKQSALKLFVDCQWCDIEHFKKEITLVNYVRDRKEADVHMIITEMNTGSGGTEYSLIFYGEGKYKPLSDTITFALPPNSTDEEERDAQIKNIKRGLTPFILRSPMANKISITYQKDKGKEEIVEDKWKSWVFETSVNGFSQGEDVYTNLNLWSNVSASKVTPDIKIELKYQNSFNQSVYRLESETIESFTRSNYGNLLITKSLGEHWAYGGFAKVYGSTYSNIEVSSSVMPAVEYNVYKYSEATTKQLRLLYKVGPQYNNYIDTTIFDKTSEIYYSQYLGINYKNVQKWGSIEGSVYGSTFLNDFSKNNVGIYVSSSFRLFKGFSLMLNGGYNQKRNQISLPKEGSSTSDILLRQKEMASNYNYWVNFGFSYTFGSIYNNVVNARFED